MRPISKTAMVEILIFVVSAILFFALISKLQSFARAEREFQRQLLHDCIEREMASKEECERMALESL